MGLCSVKGFSTSLTKLYQSEWSLSRRSSSHSCPQVMQREGHIPAPAMPGMWLPRQRTGGAFLGWGRGWLAGGVPGVNKRSGVAQTSPSSQWGRGRVGVLEEELEVRLVG